MSAVSFQSAAPSDQKCPVRSAAFFKCFPKQASVAALKESDGQQKFTCQMAAPDSPVKRLLLWPVTSVTQWLAVSNANQLTCGLAGIGNSFARI